MKKPFRFLSIPYVVWLGILAVIPFFVMVFLSFSYTEGLSLDNYEFSLYPFQMLFDSSTLSAILNSFLYALITTIISIVLGYIVAYTVFRSRLKNKFVVLAVFILPMWSNLLLRTEALGNLMNEHNIISDILSQILNTDISFLSFKGTGLAVIIGLVITYVPFMILPIYTALEKIEPALEEAAHDLGLTDFQKFWKVIFPLSLKGLTTGSIMVFLPAFSGFAIPEILGNGNILLVGNIIEQSFRYMDYNTGALLSVVILVIILGALFIVSKVDKEGETLL